MPVIPDVHGVLFLFDIICPDCRFYESSGPVVTEIINGKSKLSKISRCIKIQLIHPDFSDRSSQHVPYFPPASNE